MKIFKSKICRIMFATLVVLSVFTITAFGASTAKATSNVRFRTAVVNKLNVPEGSSAQVIRGEETLDAFEGMRLMSGDTVRTVGDATLYILVDQNKIIRLAGDTEVVLENTILGKKVKMKLVKGSMFFNVVEKLPEDESLQFVYGNITISVRGTSAVLAGQDGAFGMLLTDGTVEATETLPNGETKSAPIEAGTKFEYAAGDPEKGIESAMKTSSFTLSELPPDVVEEMKNDESLKARIVQNVPVSNGPSGPVYADPEEVDLDYDCNQGEDIMEPSEEIENKAKETRGELPAATSEPVENETAVVLPKQEETETEDTAAVQEPEPVKDEDTAAAQKTEPAKEDSPATQKSEPGKQDTTPTQSGDPPAGDNNNITPEPTYICLNCLEIFKKSELGDHFFPCGHTACQEEYENHDLLDCGEHYACLVDEDELYMHTIIPKTEETMCQNPGDWEYCKGCGEYIPAKEYVAADHAPANCGKHYSCMTDFVDKEHNVAMDCGHYWCGGHEDEHITTLDCGHYECNDDPEWVGHGVIDGDHYKCQNLYNWREYLTVETPGSGSVCLSDLDDDSEVFCPLCHKTEPICKASIKYNDEGYHMYYDPETDTISCEDVTQSVDDFRAIFEDLGYDSDQIDYILVNIIKMPLGTTLEPGE